MSKSTVFKIVAPVHYTQHNDNDVGWVMLLTKSDRYLKVSIPSESFWLKIEGDDRNTYYGTVDNHLIHTLDEYAWCKYGASVQWCKHWHKLHKWNREEEPFDQYYSDTEE